MEELLVPIGNFGFPIVLSMYLLIRLEGKMEKLNDNITRLNNLIDKNIS